MPWSLGRRDSSRYIIRDRVRNIGDYERTTMDNESVLVTSPPKKLGPCS